MTSGELENRLLALEEEVDTLQAMRAAGTLCSCACHRVNFKLDLTAKASPGSAEAIERLNATLAAELPTAVAGADQDTATAHAFESSR